MPFAIRARAPAGLMRASGNSLDAVDFLLRRRGNEAITQRSQLREARPLKADPASPSATSVMRRELILARGPPMSASGQNRKSQSTRGMSGLLPKADIQASMS